MHPLQHLSLFMECSLQLYISDDLAPAAQAQLRSLAVECVNDNGPEQPASLQVAGLLALTALESLHLLGNQVILGTPPGLWRPLPLPPLPQPTDGLPPSLTSLALDGFVDFASSVQQFVPPQVGMGWNGPTVHAPPCSNYPATVSQQSHCCGVVCRAGPLLRLLSAADGYSHPALKLL